jgi:hypothetical protein
VDTEAGYRGGGGGSGAMRGKTVLGILRVIR